MARRVHQHIDVFAGPKQKFVRGLTLQPSDGELWIVYDDFGVVGPAGPISQPLPEAEATRFALAKLHSVVEKPVRPLGAPALVELGYPTPSWRDVLCAIFLRRPYPGEVGPDGRALS